MFDNVPAADPEMQEAFYNLILDRRVGHYVLNDTPKRDKRVFIEDDRKQPEWQRRRNQSRRAKSRMQEDY